LLLLFCDPGVYDAAVTAARIGETGKMSLLGLMRRLHIFTVAVYFVRGYVNWISADLRGIGNLRGTATRMTLATAVFCRSLLSFRFRYGIFLRRKNWTPRFCNYSLDRIVPLYFWIIS